MLSPRHATHPHKVWLIKQTRAFLHEIRPVGSLQHLLEQTSLVALTVGSWVGLSHDGVMRGCKLGFQMGEVYLTLLYQENPQLWSCPGHERFSTGPGCAFLGC